MPISKLLAGVFLCCALTSVHAADDLSDDSPEVLRLESPEQAPEPDVEVVPPPADESAGKVKKFTLSGIKFDSADISTLPLREFFKGFLPREVELSNYLGATCRVHFFYRPKGARAQAPVLFIHGYSDTGNGYRAVFREIASRKISIANLMWVDWPHHGRTLCPQAKTFLQASRAVALAFKRLLISERIGAPRAIVGHSMGTAMSSVIAKDYPDAKLVWLAPPLMNPPSMMELVEFTLNASTSADGKRWLELVGKDPVPRLPLRQLPILKQLDATAHWIANKTILKRVQRARPVLEDFKDNPDSLDELAGTMAEVPADRVTILVGKNDNLTPWNEAHETMKRAFDGHVVEVNCGHNIHRDCPREAVDAMILSNVLTMPPPKDPVR